MAKPINSTQRTLCRFGCGRASAPGRTRNGNEYDTCCRTCATSVNMSHDYQCSLRHSGCITEQQCGYSITKIGRNVELQVNGEGFFLDWEIFVSQNIEQAMSMKIVSRLKQQLIALGIEHDDWRSHEPILNIIDPDLFVLKIYDKDRYWLSDRHKAKVMEEDEDHLPNDPQNDWNQLQKLDAKGYFIRRRYQWLATQFRETEEGNIEIITPIHNLTPRMEYAEMYHGIEHVFEKMLPLFNRYPAFRERKNKEFQVIVKAQRYEVEDMSGYSGHWHQEGLTENIIIGGLYYFEKDLWLKGGNLQFKNKRWPDEEEMGWNFEDEEEEPPPIEHEVKVDEGTVIVFDNVQLVHRVRMLKNKASDQIKRHRSFLAFFIVDPGNPIESTRKHPSLMRDVFVQKLLKYTPIESADIVSMICDFASCGYTLEEAKQIRDVNIEFKKNPLTRGNLAYCHHGNYGENFWFSHGKVYPNKPYECIYNSENSGSSGSGLRTTNVSAAMVIRHLLEQPLLSDETKSLTFQQKGDLMRGIKRLNLKHEKCQSLKAMLGWINVYQWARDFKLEKVEDSTQVKMYNLMLTCIRQPEARVTILIPRKPQ